MSNAESPPQGTPQPLDESAPKHERGDLSARLVPRRPSLVHRDEAVARSLPTTEVAAFLRSLVGLPPSDQEGAEVAGRAAPAAIDATAWIGWALAGLHACALPSGPTSEDDGVSRRRGPWVPSIRAMTREARRVAVVVAMQRHGGNLSRAALALGTSRRALRETLKAAGLYPWGGASADDDGSENDTSVPAVEGPDVEGGE